MDSPDDNSELEQLKIDRQRHKLLGAGGGAHIEMKDGRLTKLESWFWGFLGLAIVTGSFTAANNLYNLNLTVAQGVKNDAVLAAQIHDHEERLRQVERDVSTIEGKVFRGVDGYGEAARGK